MNKTDCSLVNNVHWSEIQVEFHFGVESREIVQEEAEPTPGTLPDQINDKPKDMLQTAKSFSWSPDQVTSTVLWLKKSEKQVSIRFLFPNYSHRQKCDVDEWIIRMDQSRIRSDLIVRLLTLACLINAVRGGFYIGEYKTASWPETGRDRYDQKGPTFHPNDP